MKTKKIITILICFISVLMLTGCNEKEEETKKNMVSKVDKYEKKINVNIEIEKYGTVSLELYPNLARETVENFVTLAKNGFYDGLTFHRIIDGFMIQGGDSEKENAKTIKGEFKENGYDNDLKHERGVISMARTPYDYNSASSQFFIVQTTSPHLDGEYASFGRVTSGMEIVDKICKDTPVEDNNGTVLKENQPKIKKIYVVEE